MNALLSIEDQLINVTGVDDEDLLMRIKDEIINRIDDELDALNEELESGESENCLVDVQNKIFRLEREYSRVSSRDDISGLRWMGYSIQLI